MDAALVEEHLGVMSSIDEQQNLEEEDDACKGVALTQTSLESHDAGNEFSPLIAPSDMASIDGLSEPGCLTPGTDCGLQGAGLHAAGRRKHRCFTVADFRQNHARCMEALRQNAKRQPFAFSATFGTQHWDRALSEGGLEATQADPLILTVKGLLARQQEASKELIQGMGQLRFDSASQRKELQEEIERHQAELEDLSSSSRGGGLLSALVALAAAAAGGGVFALALKGLAGPKAFLCPPGSCPPPFREGQGLGSKLGLGAPRHVRGSRCRSRAA